MCMCLATPNSSQTQRIPTTRGTGKQHWLPDEFPDRSCYVLRPNPFDYVCCNEPGCVHYVGGLPVNLNVCAFFKECYLHPRGVDINCDYIFNGVLHRFRIVDDGCSIPGYCRSNYSSITAGEFQQSMNRTVTSELSQGKISKVIDIPHCVHAIGGIAKRDGSLRPITDCKRPIGSSINSFMQTTACEFKYKTLDYVSELLTAGDYLGVVDIKSAYRMVHIYPPHRVYHGFEWRGEYLVDNRLSFGLKCAPFIFTNISDFVTRVMYRYGYKICINYIDNFLCHGTTFDTCVNCQRFLIKVLEYLGFEVASQKVVTPSTSVVYLGIGIDTIAFEYSLRRRNLTI